MEGLQYAGPYHALGVQGVVHSVRLHGYGVPGEGVRLGQVARCRAEHGELLSWRGHDDEVLIASIGIGDSLVRVEIDSYVVDVVAELSRPMSIPFPSNS